MNVCVGYGMVKLWPQEEVRTRLGRTFIILTGPRGVMQVTRSQGKDQILDRWQKTVVRGKVFFGVSRERQGRAGSVV